MGLEVISNIGASYKEVPKEIIPKNNEISQHMHMMSSDATQNISQTETKAVQMTNQTQYQKEFGEKAKTYENSNQKLKKALEKANKNAKNTTCEFHYHEDTNRISISIKDNETGDVIKEIPAEETLDMLSRMWELAGLFVDDKR